MYRIKDLMTIEMPSASPLYAIARATIEDIDNLIVAPRSRPLRMTIMKKATHVLVNALYSSIGNNATIELNRAALEPHFMLAHEIGHFLDNLILHPLSRTWASHYDNDFMPLLTARFESTPLLEMGRIAVNRKVPLAPHDRHDLMDFLKPREVFARVFAQWVALKSNHHAWPIELQNRLQRSWLAARPISLQWDFAEFNDIMAFVDELFARKGLI